MIQVFYGDGKGKSSSLNGAAVRAHGAGLKVEIFRFLKGRETSEDKVLNDAGIKVTKIHYGTKFVIEMNESEKMQTKTVIMEGLEKVAEASKRVDVLILDEFMDLSDKTVKMLTEKEMADFIKRIASPQKEIIISGHLPVKGIMDQADLITEVKNVRHYYEKGVKARKGFEF